MFMDVRMCECIVYEKRVFWAPNGTRLSARAISRGPKNSRFPAPTHPTSPRNESARIKNITHGAV
jgi:hypothetical protein